jgi:hypothetical protein
MQLNTKQKDNLKPEPTSMTDIMGEFTWIFSLRDQS